MRDRIHERDRHERERELGHESPGRLHHRPRNGTRGEVGEKNEGDSENQASEVEAGDQELPRSGPIEDVRRLDAGEQVLPGGRPAVPVEPDRAERDGNEEDRSRNRLRAPEARQRYAQPDPAVDGRSGAIRAMYANRIAKPSPRAVHVSRPNESMPKSATYVYSAIANARARGFEGSE